MGLEFAGFVCTECKIIQPLAALRLRVDPNRTTPKQRLELGICTRCTIAAKDRN